MHVRYLACCKCVQGLNLKVQHVSQVTSIFTWKTAKAASKLLSVHICVNKDTQTYMEITLHTIKQTQYNTKYNLKNCDWTINIQVFAYRIRNKQ